MEPHEYARMARVEDTHWWYQGMAALTASLLERFRPRPGPMRLLDAGCGTGGALARYLGGLGEGFGCDVAREAIRYSRLRGLDRLARASITELPYADDAYDVVTSLDVLYERAVGDDALALREMARVLRPGGVLLIRVPAHDWLRGQHDRATHTARRYAAGRLRCLIAQAGLRLAHLTYANALLFLPAAAKRLFERIAPPPSTSSDLDWDAGLLQPWLRRLLVTENKLAAGRGLPLGLSLVVVAVKDTH